MSWSSPLSQPKRSLVLYFACWKLFLFLITAASPGPGYDTSTHLLTSSASISSKFVRWDAIYFTQVAHRGYIFEQEWAFSRSFSWIVEQVAEWMRFYSITKASHSEAWAGILVAHASHLGSVLVLHGLSKTIFLSHVKARQIAFISACLHIISPAGLFLSAPYSESLFAFLQFTAFYFYARATFARQPTSRDGNTLLAGLFLGAASVIRSNALLGGILFAYDAVTDGIRFIQAFGNTGLLRKLMVTGLAGSFVAIGFVLPQYIAHTEYCEIRDGVPVREWCSRSIPSIYTFVQSFYWNVGFLRYWTLSNVPLFLIATPMLSILIYSSYWTFVGLPTEVRATSISTLRRKDVLLPSRAVSLVQLLACTQAALAALAITNYHIQIITRLASGYPVWYWWLAIAMSRPPKADERGNKTRVITRWMLMYAVIQGGLFASFLPPA